MLGYCKLYTIAEFFCIEVLQNVAMDMYNVSQQILPSVTLDKCIDWIFTHSPDSKMSAYMSSTTACDILKTEKDQRSSLQELVRARPLFWADVLYRIQVAECTTVGDKYMTLPSAQDDCNWHTHLTTERCHAWTFDY
jgi:hypothetical protein